MGQPKIFISYRRDDAAGYARAVNDALVRRFGADGVFIDVDDIHAGQPFSEVIQRSVGGSAVQPTTAPPMIPATRNKD